MTDEMTDEELAQKLSQIIGTAPMPDEKHNVHTFLFNVATAEDTTKVGFLRDDSELNELGVPALPLRTYKELGLFCKEIADMDYFADYFMKKGEIITSTSLSRKGKLIDLAVVQRREIADITKHRKINKGWFKKKKPEDREEEE